MTHSDLIERLEKAMDREIGMACWPGGDRRGCDAQVNITLRKGESRARGDLRLERKAALAGWCIGHLDGQSYYVCPEHKNSVFDPIPLNATLSRHGAKKRSITP